ncbi:MAG: type II secretion system protein [bacterium]|nr:type II secretion system protein [bacterium]
MNKRKKGFTLIELLVAITIMGIIAAIILMYLNNTRGRGNDTKVRAQLVSARSTAEIFYSNKNSYNGLAGDISDSCITSSSMFTDTVSDMAKYTDQSNYPNNATLTCYSTASAYAISALLPGAGGTNSWCVDSLNNSKARPTPINSTTC